MEQESLKVSIIIPTFNRQKLVVESIESCLNQTYCNLEIIVVDDGSTDNTKQAIDGIIAKDDRVKYFYKENGGQIESRNLGVAGSKGEYIIFLDSDDLLVDSMVQKMVKAFEDNSDTDMVCCGNYSVDEAGKKVLKTNPCRKNKSVKIKGNFLREYLFGEIVPCYGAFMILKKVFLHVGLPDKTMKKCGDLELFIKQFTSNTVYIVDEPLVKIRDHEDAVRLGRSGMFDYASHMDIIVSKVLDLDSKYISFFDKRFFAQRWYYRVGKLFIDFENNREQAKKYFLKAFLFYPLKTKSLKAYIGSYFG